MPNFLSSVAQSRPDLYEKLRLEATKRNLSIKDFLGDVLSSGLMIEDQLLFSRLEAIHLAILAAKSQARATLKELCLGDGVTKDDAKLDESCHAEVEREFDLWKNYFPKHLLY